MFYFTSQPISRIVINVVYKYLIFEVVATTDTYSLLNTLSESPDTFHKKNPIIKKMYQHLGRGHTHTHTHTHTELFLMVAHSSTQYKHLLKTDVYLNYIENFSSYLTENTVSTMKTKYLILYG